MNHPFAGSSGSKRRKHLAEQVGTQQGYECFICQCILYSGRKAANASVLEHLKPWRLSPDHAYDPDNLRLCCKRCHDTVCQSIEDAHWPDAEMIAQAKLRLTTEWE